VGCLDDILNVVGEVQVDDVVAIVRHGRLRPVGLVARAVTCAKHCLKEQRKKGQEIIQGEKIKKSFFF
jgi:hypothetical protein